MVASTDETSIETQEGETLSQARKGNKKLIIDEESGKSGDYDISLRRPIVLRKGTKSYTKNPMYSFLSYSNLFSEFKVLPALIQ